MPSKQQLSSPLLSDDQEMVLPALKIPDTIRAASDPLASTRHPVTPVRLIRAKSDPMLVQILSASRLESSDKDKVFLAGFVTFFALVLYEHTIYDLMRFNLGYTATGIFSGSLVIVGTLILTVSRSLESLVQYEAGGHDVDENNNKVSRQCCGLADKDLRYVGKLDCTVQVGKYRFFFLRALKYNFNATLITLVWLGAENFIGYLQYRITNYVLGPRLVLDFFLLCVSNFILIYLGQLSGQFGVYDDNVVLAYKTRENKAPCVKTFSDGFPTPPASPIALPPEPFSPSDVLPPAFPFPADPSSAPSSPRSVESPPTKKHYQLNISTQLKMVATLLAIVIYWYCIWDVFGSLPSEAILVEIGEGTDDTDDDGRGHREVSKRVEYIFIALGVGYCIAAGMVLIVSGELFAFINRDEDDEAMEAQRETEAKVSTRLSKYGLPDSFSLDVAWRFGDKVFLPLRLVQYNILGIFGVIAWIGMDFLILAFANLCIYDKHQGPQNRYPLDIAYLILANILLTYLEQFGNQYGGDFHLKEKHEIVTIENPVDEML